MFQNAARAPRRWPRYVILSSGLFVGLGALAAQRAVDAGGGAALAAPAGIASAPLAAVAAIPVPAVGVAQVAAAARAPRVELVFALDTTGSMEGLIEGAKRKIWGLASFIAKGQPTPELRVGLVAYRDLGDAYVVRRFDLDADLDRVYARLRQLRADGGGDTPEHVARALDEAVNKMSWTADQAVVKLIYLVGDAPAHTDYGDGFSLDKAVRAAARKGIAVHAIRCGTDPETASAWRRVAMLGRGEFLTIRQDGGMRTTSTPFDDEIAKLHDAVGATAIGYGPGAASVSGALKLAASAPAEVKAERAAFMAKKGHAVGGEGDLVDAVNQGTVNLASVDKKSLPEPMRGLSADELRESVAATRARRQEIQGQIEQLTAKRDQYLRAHADKEADDGAFDASARRALEKTVSDNPRAGLKL